MFEENFVFPGGDLFDDDKSSEKTSKDNNNKSTRENPVAVVKPYWFLEDDGHPAHCPQAELEMARAFLCYQKGFLFFIVFYL